MTLRTLVDEGHRIRVQLSAITALIRRGERSTAVAASPSPRTS